MKRLLQNILQRALLLFFAFTCGSNIFAQTADFTINVTQGCVPLGGVNFTDISSGGTVTNRDWNLGNGTIINNGAAVVGTNYLTAVTFPVTLTVTFLGGTIRSVTKNVVVHPKPIANFNAIDTAGCAPHTVAFQDLSTTATGTITSWQWDFGAGGSAAPNPSFIYTAPGLYNISLIVNNSWGCQSDAATKFQYIKVYNRPVASFTANPFFGCTNTLNVNFNNTTTSGSPGNTYLWNFGDGVTSTLKSPSHFYAAPGTYTVTLTASVGNNCSSTTTRTVYVGNVTPFFTAAPDTVCINVPTLFSGSATPAPFSVRWIFSDNGAIQNGSPTSHTFTTPGDYTITFIAYTAQGCSDTITKPIHVKAGAGLTPFFINAPDTVCVNNLTLYSGSSTPAPFSIRWYFADNGAIQNGSPTSHSFSPPGNYLVSLYVYDNRGCADTISKTVNVKSGPVSSFIPDKINGCGIPFTVTFTNTTPGTNLQFTWNFGDGTPLLVVNDTLPVTHVYNTFGNFTVTLTARDTLIGCAGQPVTVLIRNYQPTVNFTYVPPAGCLPLPVFFTAQVTNLIVPGIKYVWNYGDGSPLDTVAIPNGFHLYTSAGVFLATLTIITSECTYTTISKPVTVIDLCDDDGSGDGGGGGDGGFVVGKTCTDKYTVTFTDTLKNNTVVVSWNFGDGTPWYTTPPLNPVTHTYSPPQKVYIVTVARLDTITGLPDTARKRVIIIDEKANFVPDLTDICNNKTVRFSTIGIDSSKISTYTWDFGDGTPRQVINNTAYFNAFGLYLNGNTSHTYNDTGYFYVKLIIRDKLGCLDSLLYPIPIRVSAPAAVFGADVQLSCLVPLKVIFTDTSRQNGSNVIVNRQWNFGDGSPLYNTNLDTAIAHFYNANTYTVRLTVTDAIGCTSTVTKPLVVPVVTTGPKAGFFAGPVTSCASPQTVVFTDTSKKSGIIPIVEWQWTFGDGTPVLLNTVDTPLNHIYTGNSYVNFYSVTLRVKDSIGCTSTVTLPNYIKLYKPKANFFSYDTLKCGAYNVFLYNTSLAYNAVYTWYYGDGTSSTGFYGSHTYATEGQYDIKLVVRDENGCLDSMTKTSYIKLVRPKADFKIGDTSKCAPVAIIFTDSSKYASAWLWDFGDGGTGSTDKNPSPHIYALPGFYRVKLIVTGLNGCVDSTFKWIRVRGPIATLLAPPAAGCKPFTFNAKVQGTFINTYAWDFGDGTPVNASLSDSVISHVYIKGGKYLPNVVLISPEGCPYTLKASDSVIVDSAKAVFAPLSSVFCGSGTVSFTNLSKTTNFSSFTNYAWDFGDGSPIDGAATPAPHVYGPGNYDVSLTVTSFYGCVDTFIKPLAVIVHPLPKAGIAGDSILCKPGLHDYTSAISSIDRIQAFAWYVNNVPVSTDSNLSYYFSGGNYTIKLIVRTVNGCYDSVSRNIIVDFVSAAFSTINPVRCANDLAVQFNNGSISLFGGSSSLWNFGDGTGSALINPPVHIYPGYGNYDVSLLVTTVHGCKDSVKISPAVKIHPLPRAGIAGDNILCRPGLHSYTSDITSIDRIQTFAWYINGVQVSADSNLNHYFNAGNYTVKIVVQTVNGCYDSISRNIIVDLVVPAFSAVNPVRCANDLSVQFNNNSGTQFGASDYLWNFGDGTGSNLANPPVHVYPGYGNYDVSLLVTTVHGCKDSVAIRPAVTIHPLPKAGIAGDSILCKPGLHDYASAISSIDRIQAFAWYVNNVPVSADSNLNHYFNPGNYTIKLVVRTVNGCYDSISRNIIVDLVVPAFTAVNPVRCANDLSVQFNNNSGTQFGASDYLWNFGDGTGSNLANPPVHVYPGYGNYNVSLLVTTVHGCKDSVAIRPAVTIHPLPSAAGIIGDSIRCKPGVYNYNSVINSIDRIQSFNWKVNGVSVSADSNLNHYFNAGNYIIKLVVRTVNGCPDSISRNIIVDSVTAAFSAINPVRCGDDLTVLFNNLSGSKFGIASYLWNFGDLTASTQQNPPPHVYPRFGIYDVSLLAVSVHGCRDSVKIDSAVTIYSLPSALIDGDSIHCKPGMYQYRSVVNTLDAVRSYQWKVNGNVVGSSANLQYSFSAGAYQVELKILTDNNCSNTVTRNIIIDSVRARFSVNRPIRCGSNDLTVSFNNLSGSKFNITNYTWLFGDGQNSALITPVHTYAAPGTYDIELTAISEHGCTDTGRITAGVVIYKTPTVKINGVTEKCMKNTLAFTAQIVSEDAVASLQWKVNGIPAGNGTTLNYFFANAGTYSVVLDAATTYGCAVSDTFAVVIRPLPIPNAQPNTTVCEGSSVRLRAFDGVGYEWSPAATLQYANTDTAMAAPLQTTWYKVKVTNLFGCEQFDSVEIKVDKKVNLQVSPNVATCRGTAVQLSATGNTTQFTWSPVTGLGSPNTAVTSAKPDTTTTYTATGISTNVCPSESASITVTVGQIPAVNIGPDMQVTAGTPVNLTPVYTNGVTQYLWTPSTGLNCTNCPQPSFVADKSITYKVVVRTQYGCTATDEINIAVLCGKGSVFIPNAFTPDNDGKNDVFFVSGYGIAKVKRFSVFDRWGKLLFNKENFPAGDRKFGWDGNVLGSEVTTTTAFVYIVEVECVGGTTIPLKGSVLLVR